MTFTAAEREAIAAHSTALGLSADEYIRQTAAARALSWQRERETFTQWRSDAAAPPPSWCSAEPSPTTATNSPHPQPPGTAATREVRLVRQGHCRWPTRLFGPVRVLRLALRQKAPLTAARTTRVRPSIDKVGLAGQQGAIPT